MEVNKYKNCSLRVLRSAGCYEALGTPECLTRELYPVTNTLMARKLSEDLELTGQKVTKKTAGKYILGTWTGSELAAMFAGAETESFLTQRLSAVVS